MVVQKPTQGLSVSCVIRCLLFSECLKELVLVDKRGIPEEENCSLYIRPAYIGTQVGIIHGNGFVMLGVMLQVYSTAAHLCTVLYV